jgi:tetratricopeptide (TPR) repeat protein
VPELDVGDWAFLRIRNESGQVLNIAGLDLQKVLGAGHPDVAAGLRNMAALYTRNDRDREAEELYRRALRIDEITSGRSHLWLVVDLQGLATALQTARSAAEAKSALRRAAGILEAY